jgi:hypothetical protein
MDFANSIEVQDVDINKGYQFRLKEIIENMKNERT